MKGMKIKEAVELWVNLDMTAIPMSVIEKLYKIGGCNDLHEITPVVKGTRV